MPEYLTVREVAALYRVNEITVRRHIRSGKLRAVKVGGRVRVEKGDVERFPAPAFTPGKLNVPRRIPTAEDLAKRRELAARSDAFRARVKPLDFSIVDVIRQARDPDGDWSDD